MGIFASKEKIQLGLQMGAVLVDARSYKDFENGHHRGAIHVCVDQPPAEIAANVAAQVAANVGIGLLTGNRKRLVPTFINKGIMLKAAVRALMSAGVLPSDKNTPIIIYGSIYIGDAFAGSGYKYLICPASYEKFCLAYTELVWRKPAFATENTSLTAFTFFIASSVK